MHLPLFARLGQSWSAEPFVARLSEARPGSVSSASIVHLQRSQGTACLRLSGIPNFPTSLSLPDGFTYLREGDIVRINPQAGEMRVLYRRGSAHNVLFITERCNSRCLMCSQPPRTVDDEHHLDAIEAAVPLMDPSATPELCITGGEPMLAGTRIFQIVRLVKRHLPYTSLHMLSNGRLFRHLALAQGLAASAHPDLMLGIPLYADTASRHDFVVQAKGAFDETIRGLLNLERIGVRIELRVVIHQQTAHRLPALARFIARNLPFVSQIAFMGLEITGYTRPNLEALWIEPLDYQRKLTKAVTLLTTARLKTLIYNHPLCLLPRDLWPFARKSISDWKNVFLPECQSCDVQAQCGGFFASAQLRHSKHLQAVREQALISIK